MPKSNTRTHLFSRVIHSMHVFFFRCVAVHWDPPRCLSFHLFEWWISITVHLSSQKNIKFIFLSVILDNYLKNNVSIIKTFYDFFKIIVKQNKIRMKLKMILRFLCGLHSLLVVHIYLIFITFPLQTPFPSNIFFFNFWYTFFKRSKRLYIDENMNLIC